MAALAAALVGFAPTVESHLPFHIGFQAAAHSTVGPSFSIAARNAVGSSLKLALPAPPAQPPAAAPPVTRAPAPAPAPATVVSRSAPVRVAPAPPLVVGSAQQALINGDRAGAGLGPLTWNSCLAQVAAQNAAQMAGQGAISHTNGVYADLGCGIGTHSGENVGDWSLGINDAQLNQMFMASPDHRANIMGSFHYVATAWARAANGYAYITVEFD